MSEVRLGELHLFRPIFLFLFQLMNVQTSSFVFLFSHNLFMPKVEMFSGAGWCAALSFLHLSGVPGD